MEKEKKKNPIKDEDLDQVTGGMNNDGSTVLKVGVKCPTDLPSLGPILSALL